MCKRKGIIGGIPDKDGNEYEEKWLVHCFFDILWNKAEWIKYEGIQTEYEGFEFAIKKANVIEWHQAKQSESNGGNWTVKRLEHEKVLKNFLRCLSANESNHCYFISGDSAKGLQKLSEKARISDSVHDFLEYALSQKDSHVFENLKCAWNSLDDKSIYQYLRRCFFEVYPQSLIETNNERDSHYFFVEDSSIVSSVIYNFFKDKFNREVKKDSYLAYLKKSQLLRYKDWNNTVSVSEFLNKAKQTYLKSFPTFGFAGKVLKRNAVDTVVSNLNEKKLDIIMVSGCAGSGKSGIIRGVIDFLAEKSMKYLVLRIDHYLECNSIIELGKSIFNSDESPIVTFKRAYPDRELVVVIDQLDAISEISGRNGAIKRIVSELISECQSFGSIKVVLSCRTFDLENDNSIKGYLSNPERANRINIPKLHWELEVSPILKNCGFDESSISEKQKMLLSQPINLAIFLEINDKELVFTNSNNLHDEFLKKKKRDISNKGYSINWNPVKVLTIIAESMSRKQTLSAPVTLLDDYNRAEEVLQTEGLITCSNNKLSFYHESFFDFLFARSFVSKEISIVDFLLEHEQHLFRRTQVRQILESQRMNNLDGYINDIENLFSNKKIRYHIKDSIAKWMGSLPDPKLEELNLVWKLFYPCTDLNPLLKNIILTNGQWLVLLLENNRVSVLLESENTRDLNSIIFFLRKNANTAPDQISIILKKWWELDQENRSDYLLDFFEFVNYDENMELLIELYFKVIKSKPENLFQRPGLYDIWGFPSRIASIMPIKTGEYIKDIYEIWKQNNPEKEFWEVDHHSFKDLIENEPFVYLVGTTEILYQTVIGNRLSESRLAKRYKNGHYGFDRFLSQYRDALIGYAKTSPELAFKFVEMLNYNKYECFMHLCIETIIANPQALHKKVNLVIDNPLIFEAGFSGARWWSFAEMVKATIGFLSDVEKDKIEDVLLQFQPEIRMATSKLNDLRNNPNTYFTKKSVLNSLRDTGYTIWCVFQVIDLKSFSCKVRKRFFELERKFSDREVETPEVITGLSYSRSPYENNSVNKMNTEDWLKIFKKFDDTNQESETYGLLSQLQRLSKVNPKRYLTLALQVKEGGSPKILEKILWGVFEADIEKVPLKQLSTTIKYLHSFSDKPFGYPLTFIFRKYTDLSEEKFLLDILLWYASKGEADELNDLSSIEKQTDVIKLVTNNNDQYMISDTKSVRANAWIAIESILWANENVVEYIWEFFETQLCDEDLISVRCCMINILGPLLNKNKMRVIQNLDNLVTIYNDSKYENPNLYLSPLVTYQGLKLFHYFHYHNRSLGDKLLKDLLESDIEKHNIVGAWLLFNESFRDEGYIQWASMIISKSIIFKRLMAHVVSSTFLWTENKKWARKLLFEFLYDEDDEVKEKVAHFIAKINKEFLNEYEAEVLEFIKSPALKSDNYSLLNLFNKAEGSIKVFLQALIKRYRSEEIRLNGKKEVIDSYRFQDLIDKEYVSSEKDSEYRKELLDIIDYMLEKEIYGIGKVLEKHERW